MWVWVCVFVCLKIDIEVGFWKGMMQVTMAMAIEMEGKNHYNNCINGISMSGNDILILDFCSQ